MFPLSNIYEHFPQTLEKKTSENIDYDHQNPNSSSYEDHHDQQYSTFPYSNFPAIFEDDGLLLSHLLSQQQLILAGNTSSHSSQAHTTDEISVVASNQAVLDHHYHDHDHHKPSHDENPSKLGFSKKQRAKVLQTIIPRRRTGKKDRHSKISTAQGLRDRRMRLSLQIARKFFDLQDMLGFDKASKTIEWLITKSRTAIKELKDSLAKQSCTTTSTSEGEVVSKTAEKEDSDDDDDDHNQSSIRLHKEKKIRKLHKVIARESREKARARARERTRGKILEKSRQSTSSRTTDQAANDINTSVDLGKSRPNSSTSLKKGDSTKQEIMNSSSLKMVAASRFDQEPRLSDQLLDYSISNHIGVSSGANSEDDFLGFPGVIGNVGAQNPCPIFTTTLSPDAEEQKPSSFFPITTTSNPQRQYPSSNFVTTSTDTHVEVNLSSVFMATGTSHCNSAAEEQNPRPVFVAAPNIVHQEQNPSSNFLMGTTNIFCNLNF